MLIDPIRLQQTDLNHVTASWTSAHPDWYAWAYLDGRFALGPIAGDAEQSHRSVTVLWPAGEVHALEVHELPTLDVVCDPANSKPGNVPVLSWSASGDAERYRIYHRDPAAVDDSLIFDGLVATDPLGICRLTCPVPLDGRGGRWHFLRVEAVDRFGHESTRAAWCYWATEPADVPTVAIAPGSDSGLYTLSIEV